VSTQLQLLLQCQFRLLHQVVVFIIADTQSLHGTVLTMPVPINEMTARLVFLKGCLGSINSVLGYLPFRTFLRVPFCSVRMTPTFERTLWRIRAFRSFRRNKGDGLLFLDILKSCHTIFTFYKKFILPFNIFSFKCIAPVSPKKHTMIKFYKDGRKSSKCAVCKISRNNM
jgi:hypothetical protein